MVQDQIRVIKISGQALFEFIYESFIEKQQDLLDLDPTEVSNLFEFDSENGEFIFCAVKTEDEKGNLLPLPKKFDLAAILRNIPDTTESVFSPSDPCYRDYSRDEFFRLSEGASEKDS